MPTVLSVAKERPLRAFIRQILRSIPYTLLVRIGYTLLKRELRKYPKLKRHAKLISQGVVVALVGNSHREYFIIHFILEYFFAKYVYENEQNRNDWFMAGILCMLAMGLFALAASEGKVRAIRPLNFISGYDINDMTKWWQTGKFMRPEGSNMLKWHLMLYVKTAKNALLPLTMAVWLPTFLSSLFTGNTIERETYASMMTNLNTLQDEEPDKRANIKKAFVTASKKAIQYGSYLVIGLSQYVHVLEMYNQLFKHPPTRSHTFYIGLWGGMPFFLIPKDKIHAYNHWALTTMVDAMLQ